MAKQLSAAQRAQIAILSEQNKSTREIAKIMSVSQPTVVKTLKKHREFNTFDHIGGNGRPTKLNRELKRCILSLNKNNNRLSTRKIAADIKNMIDIKVSHTSIKKFLNELNVFAFSPRKKPLLTPKHIKERFRCSKIWLKMTEEVIKTIIFTDETKFNLFYSDGKVSVWREPGTELNPKNIVPTVKYGGVSVMVWACFSYNGRGNLHFIEGIMDAPGYVHILSINLYSSLYNMRLDEFIFQQDLDPKHTSRLASEFFDENGVNLLPWPPQSPDMNPIENLWSIIKVKVQEKRPKTKTQLKEMIIQAWNEIPETVFQNLALSFKNRALALYRANGGYTDY